MVERPFCIRKVEGSNPSSSIFPAQAERQQGLHRSNAWTICARRKGPPYGVFPSAASYWQQHTVQQQLLKSWQKRTIGILQEQNMLKATQTTFTQRGRLSLNRHTKRLSSTSTKQEEPKKETQFQPATRCGFRLGGLPPHFLRFSVRCRLSLAVEHTRPARSETSKSMMSSFYNPLMAECDAQEDMTTSILIIMRMIVHEIYKIKLVTLIAR